ncbi:MAG: DUF7487 domain-containing protein [bacterium]
MKEKIYCKICDTQTNLTIDCFSRYHLKKEHNIGMLEYYDRYIKKDGEGVCECGKKTKYYGYYQGYAKFCSIDCSNKSEYMRKQISDSFKNRDIKKESEKRKGTCLKKYGVESISQSLDIKKRKKETCLSKYGVESNLLTQDCYDLRWKSLNENKEEINKKRSKSWNEELIEKTLISRRNTCLKKYGVDSIFKIDRIIDKIRKSNENSGYWLSIDEYSEYKKYKLSVNSLSKKHYGELFKNWDGRDYYTGEYLITNEEYKKNKKFKGYSYNKLQPTIDHKISIFYGFINGMSIEEISHIDNLCICGRSVNSSKNKKCEWEFLKNKEVK